MTESKPTSNNRGSSQKVVGLRSKDKPEKPNFKSTKYERFYTIRMNSLLLDISHLASSNYSTENFQISPSPYKKFWIQAKSISDMKFTNRIPISIAEPKYGSIENNGIEDHRASTRPQTNSNKTNTNNTDALTKTSKTFKSHLHQTILNNPTLLSSSVHGFMPYQERLRTTMGRIYQKRMTESQRDLNFSSNKDCLPKTNSQNSLRDDDRNVLNSKRSASFSPRTVQQYIWTQPLKILVMDNNIASVPKSLNKSGSSLKQNTNGIKFKKMKILPLAARSKS